MYDKKIYKRDLTCSWPSPPPFTNCHTFSDPLPLERDLLYGWPLSLSYIIILLQNKSSDMVLGSPAVFILLLVFLPGLRPGS